MDNDWSRSARTSWHPQISALSGNLALREHYRAARRHLEAAPKWPPCRQCDPAPT